MRIAFYAPLKAPGHPVPSGDRQIARALLQALDAGGHDAAVASRLRSFDGSGDRGRQSRLRRIGSRVAARLIARWRSDDRPQLWFTYHLHHKAPDHLGPVVSRALGIPYVVAEGSTSPRQRDGPWADGHAEALAALRAADTVLFLNPADVPAVRNARSSGAPMAMLAPFIDVAQFAGACDPPTGETRTGPLRLVSVAMMRDGAKLASYRALAAALARLADTSWELTIVGDGPARDAVAAAFVDLSHRVRFAGAQSAPEVAAQLRASDVCAWPAIDEAIGIALLEAQACGVPVIGADTPGVAAVVADGRTGILVPPGNVDRFATAIRTLALDPALRRRMAVNAFDYVRRYHDIATAAARLDAILRDVVHRHRVTRAKTTC